MCMRRTSINYRFYACTIDYFSIFQLTRTRSSTMGKKLTTQEFVDRAIKVHGDKYDYSKTQYIHSKENVIITCNIHGDFPQTPNTHSSGSGCPLCTNNNILKTSKQFISDAKIIHGDKYNYDDVIYINNKTDVIIECVIHGKFNQQPNRHLNGCGCPKCGRNSIVDSKRSNTEQFINNAKHVHGSVYDYSMVNYIDHKTPVTIICKIHGQFKQKPIVHNAGCGCPICKYSKGEIKIREYLTKHNVSYIQQHTYSDCKNVRILPFDFYIPSINTCIEYDGIQHFKPIEYFGGDETLNIVKYRDSIKTKYCNDNNINLIRIPYTHIDMIDSILDECII